MASRPCVEVVHVYHKEAVMADFDTEGNVLVLIWLSANNSETIALLVL